ncbi:DUF1289 domain-containing protein [Gemmatimonas sp.]|uniref:DUF1289 domain-containing protein n=1 Tax=Gemmatimonas sp. TaxID=1962908 RepID=UPI00391B61F3
MSDHSASQPPLHAFPTTSPCIKVCQLDLHDRCHGCGRTRHEVARWSTMTADERRAVNRRLNFRGHGDNR